MGLSKEDRLENSQAPFGSRQVVCAWTIVLAFVCIRMHARTRTHMTRTHTHTDARTETRSQMHAHTRPHACCPPMQRPITQADGSPLPGMDPGRTNSVESGPSVADSSMGGAKPVIVKRSCTEAMLKVCMRAWVGLALLKLCHGLGTHQARLGLLATLHIIHCSSQRVGTQIDTCAFCIFVLLFPAIQSMLGRASTSGGHCHSPCARKVACVHASAFAGMCLGCAR